jgi:hypothetical protein
MSMTDNNENIMTLTQWQNVYKNPYALIVQASVKDGSDSWQEFPIGMCYGYSQCDFHSPKLQIGNHEKTVFCGITLANDNRRRSHLPVNRETIMKILNNNNIFNKTILCKDYFEQLPDYKFVISPEGNGIDCHRHYEALLAGCIPIMEYNPLTQFKYRNLPVLYTRDYSEINEDYLNKVYLEMKDNTYDFSSLFLSYYNEEQRQRIYDCGNFWCSRLANTVFYR